MLADLVVRLVWVGVDACPGSIGWAMEPGRDSPGAIIGGDVVGQYLGQHGSTTVQALRVAWCRRREQRERRWVWPAWAPTAWSSRLKSGWRWARRLMNPCMRTSAGSSPGQSVTCSPPSVAGTWRMMALRLASTMAACSYDRGTVSQCDSLLSSAHRSPHQVTAWIRPAISLGFSRLAKWPVALSVMRWAPGIARALASRSAGCDQSLSP